LGRYADITDAYSNKEIVVAVTMSDIAIESFKEDTKHTAPTDKNWGEFRQHIHEILEDGGLLGFQVDRDEIYPVYFDVEETKEDGEISEDINLDSGGNLAPLRGAYRLLDRIGG
jgi:hypothetical protein